MKTEVIPDPLQQGLDLPLKGAFYPLGFPLEVETNSADVLRGLEESFSGFQPMFPRPPLRLHVAVSEHESGELPPLPAYLGRRHLLAVIADARNFAVLDYTRNFAFCWLTALVAREREWACHHILEGVVYCAQAQLYLTPIHAACVARNGRGLLLHADSGVGKSVLSYACARRGWTFLSDNCAALVRDRSDLMVLCDPFQIRLRESAVELFPELKGRTPHNHANGKLAIVLRTAQMPEIDKACHCLADFVLFLERDGSEPARLAPISKDEAMGRMCAEVARYDTGVRETQVRSLERLTGAGLFKLRYRSVDSAIERLESLVTGS